jgi:hypothetical protein
MRRHHHAQPVRGHRRLVAGRGRLPLHHRLGLGDLDGDLLRHLDGDRHALVGLQIAAHAFLQVDLVAAHHILGHGDLFVGFGLHEVEALAILIEEVVFALVHGGLFHLIGGLPAFRTFTPSEMRRMSTDGGRRALAGAEVSASRTT